VLTDFSSAMLAASERLNPECRHVQGDMRTLRLHRAFDAVFVHDAVGYMASAADLRAALATARSHLRPGGLALFVPDCVRETFAPGMSTGGCDRQDRALRFLEWVHDPDPGDDTYMVDYAFLLRDGASPVRVEHDHHVLGLFARADWMAWLQATGFEPELRRVPTDQGEHEVFVARCR
jgi:trans-aconitate methyltransferase